MFVTQRLRGGPQPGPGARVGPGQRRRAVPVQHLVHRRGVQPQPKPDPGRPPPAPDPQPQDPPFGAPAQPTRAVLRPARTVRHRVPAVQPVPVGPTLRGGHRHSEPVRRPPQRPPVIDHAPGQPPGRCQGALRWDMRPSRVSVSPSDSPTPPGCPPHLQQARPVTNPRGPYTWIESAGGRVTGVRTRRGLLRPGRRRVRR